VNSETYLAFAYSSALVASILVCAWVSLVLPPRLFQLAADLFGESLAHRLRRWFRLTIWILPLAGFASVSMTSCTVDTYAEVVADKYYVLGRTQMQIAQSAQYLLNGLVVWTTAVTILVIFHLRSNRFAGRRHVDELKKR
jgi:hypothetical protein